MGTWVKPMAEVKNDAPAIIKAIMQAVRTAANSESVKITRLKWPLNRAMIIDSTTPTAAASVGEASPP